MTLEEAHKKLDEEYANNEVVQIGFKYGKVPDSVRVAIALQVVADKARLESSYFSMSCFKKSYDEIINLDEEKRNE